MSITVNSSSGKKSSGSSGSGQGLANKIARSKNLGNRTSQTYSTGDKEASKAAKNNAAQRSSNAKIIPAQDTNAPVNTIADQSTPTNSQTESNYEPIASSVGGGVIIQDKKTQEIYAPVSSPATPNSPTTYNRIYAPPQNSAAVERAMREARQEDKNTIKNIKVDTNTNNQVLVGLRTGAAKTAIFLEQSGKQGSAIAADERASPSFFQRAVSYPTAALAYGATAVSQPFRQFATSDKELGKEIVLGYAGGKAIGVVAGELPNFAARGVIGKYGSSAASKAYASTNIAIGGTGIVLTGASLYGKSAEETGKMLPSLVVGGFAAKSAFDLGGKQGVQVTGIKQIGSSKPVVKGTPDSFGVYTKNTNVAEVSVYGKPVEVPFNSVTSVAGGKLPSGKFAIDATTYGNVQVAGKNFGFSDTYSGFQTGRALGIKDVKTQNIFSATTTKPKLLIENQQGTNIGENIYSTKTKFALTTAKGEPLSAGYSKTLSSQYEYTNRDVFSFKKGALAYDKVSGDVLLSTPSKITTYPREGFVGQGVSVTAQRSGVPVVDPRVVRAGNKALGIGEFAPAKISYKLDVPKIVGKKGSAQLFSPEYVQESPIAIRKPVVVSQPFSIPDLGGLSLRAPATRTFFFGGVSGGAVASYGESKSVSKVISVPSIQNKPSVNTITLPSFKPATIDKTSQVPVQIPKFAFDNKQDSVSIPKIITEQKYTNDFLNPSPAPPSRKSPFDLVALGLPSGGFSKGGKGSGKGSKQSYKYTPSLTGIETRKVISGKGKGKSTGYSGLEVRGITKAQLAIIEGKGKRFVRF